MKRLLLLLTLPLTIVVSKAQITAFPDTSICPGDPVTLGSELVDVCTDCYSYEEIPYAPETIGGETYTMVDDTYIGPFDIGFDFCFFGVYYDQFYLCSNGWISFIEPAGGWAGNWTPDGPIPDAAGNVPKAAIFAPWTDWHTGLCSDCIHYEVFGVAPNRRIAITWEEVPLFSCTDLIGTFQIVLYETSNWIDNHFTDVMICPTWDLGIATQGLQNEDGTAAYTVTGRNATDWEASEESWRWYTSEIFWYDEGGTLIGTGPEVDVTPDVTTTYTLVQVLCDGTEYTDDVTVTVGAALSIDSVVVDVSCGGAGDGSISIDIGGGLEPYTYEWSTGATGVTEITGLDGGVYTCTVTEEGGCSRTYTFTVQEPETLTAEATDLVNNPCNGYEEGSVLIDGNGGTVPYTFSLDGGTPTIINEFDGLGAGDYTVLVTDASGCTTEVEFTITEPILFTADLSADNIAILGGQPVTITLETSLPDVVSVTWDPDVPCATPDDPCFMIVDTPFTTTTYYVTVVNSEGCIAIDSITIFVDIAPEVFFPAAFSPNGDLTNDVFFGNGYNISSYHLYIYNRYGNVVYETDKYIEGVGWDGRYEGVEQEMGTYVWQVQAGFGDGESFSATGNVILVR